MHLIDILLLIVLAAVFSAAVLKCIRDKKRGKHACGGDCSACSGCTGGCRR